MTRLFAGTPWDRPPKCDRCGKLEAECACPPERAPFLPPDQQMARLSVDKRKKGKLVTLIAGLSSAESDLPALLSKLQGVCGAGGTCKEDVLEIQGAHLDRVRETLRTMGYRVKG